MKIHKFLFFVGITILLFQPVFAQDWSQWRGSNRDGVAAISQIPSNWPQQLRQAWQIEVGEGHSSPIYSNGKIFVFTRQNTEEVLLCINPKDASIIWQKSYSAPYTLNPAAFGHGKGPKSTPVIAEGKIITLGINGVLSCFDITNGALTWQRRFTEQFSKTAPVFGTAMSPLVNDGLAIAHVGGQKGALMAIDIKSGDIKWQWDNDGPGYSSPLIATIAGVKQIITLSQKNIIGLAFENGKLLWQIPFQTPWFQNIQTPLFYENDLILSGLQKALMRVKIEKKNDTWSVEEVWKNKDTWTYMSSPVLFDDIIVLFSDRRKGSYAMVDAKSGEVLWQSQGRVGENAALIRVGEFLLSLQNEGKLIIAKPSREKLELIREYTVADSQTWAHPVLFDNHILIKDKTNLTLWKLN